MVTVVHGMVWLSIVPPFTWEAIMEPAKVDELIHVLALARDEAERMVMVRGAENQGQTPGWSPMQGCGEGSEKSFT